MVHNHNMGRDTGTRGAGAGDRPQLDIEFDLLESSDVDISEVAQEQPSSTRWPALMVALVVGGVFALLVFVGLGSVSNPGQDEIADDGSGPTGEADGPVADGSPETGSGEAGSITIPDGSRATVAVEALPLEFAAQNAVLLDNEVIYIDQVTSGSLTRTPGKALLFRLNEQMEWEESEREVEGLPNEVGNQWVDMRAIGENIAVTASATREGSIPWTYVSTNGVSWERVPAEFFSFDTDIRFATLGLTSEAYVGVRVQPSATLERFLSEHTDIIERELATIGACFVGASFSVVGCDGDTTVVVDPTRVDSDVELDQVLLCLDQLRFLGPELRAASIDRLLLESIGTDDRLILGGNPVTLSDGRVVGIDGPPLFNDRSACDGVVPLEDAEPRVFQLDPTTGNTESLFLGDDFDVIGSEVLGELPFGDGLLLVVRDSWLWTLDFETGAWTRLDDIPFGGGQFFLSDSGQRLYSFNDADLRIFDLSVGEDGTGSIQVERSDLFVSVADDAGSALELVSAFSGVTDASDTHVIFVSNERTWLIEVPPELAR